MLNNATASHHLPMVKEIVANDGVTAICSLFSSENVDQIQIEALSALENIIRSESVGINADLKELIAKAVPDVPVILSHEVDPNPREFERTVSRLLEMQSPEYMALPHSART